MNPIAVLVRVHNKPRNFWNLGKQPNLKRALMKNEKTLDLKFITALSFFNWKK